MKRAIAPLLLTLPLAMPASVSAANETWNSPFTIQLGAFRADASTKIRLDPNERREGTQIHIEGDLGVTDSKTLPDVQFLWRLNNRHALEGSWVSLKRDGTLNIAGEIIFGDVVFPINASVVSTFDSDVARLAYRYSFINQDGNELAALVGVHYTTFKASISTLAGTISDSASVEAPLPTLGVRGAYRIADNWRATGFVQALKLKVGDYDGQIVNATGAVEWAFTRHAYAGLGYNYYRYKIRSEKENAQGDFDLRFGGPTLYVGWAF
jgi:hypothetical protein